MPSAADASFRDTDPPPAQASASPAVLFPQPGGAMPEAGSRQAAVCLAAASRALWAATLSLMTAFMQTAAPAHRYLLARRISRNFDTLSRQDCFDATCRASFVRLTQRWQSHADRLAPDGPRPGGRRLRSWL